MEYKHKITVFTPTYNRAYIMHQLFESLCRQSFMDFEWLIVDDGSTDNTKELVETWIGQSTPFLIRYYRQPNGGKCRAINLALNLAFGELFFTVDSDDYLTDDALEKLVSWERDLPKNGSFCGVAGNIGTAPGITKNALFDTSFREGTFLDRYRYANGERAIAIYTSIHRHYLYPVFEGEKFMTEAVAWNRMAHDGYKVRFYNDVIWIYKYQNDGLTKAGNKLFLQNPHGYTLWLKEKTLFTERYPGRLMKLYYSLYVELQGLYSQKFIADCLGINGCVLKFFSLLFKLKN